MNAYKIGCFNCTNCLNMDRYKKMYPTRCNKFKRSLTRQGIPQIHGCHFFCTKKMIPLRCKEYRHSVCIHWTDGETQLVNFIRGDDL